MKNISVAIICMSLIAASTAFAQDTKCPLRDYGNGVWTFTYVHRCFDFPSILSAFKKEHPELTVMAVTPLPYGDGYVKTYLVSTESKKP